MERYIPSILLELGTSELFEAHQLREDCYGRSSHSLNKQINIQPISAVGFPVGSELRSNKNRNPSFLSIKYLHKSRINLLL